MHKLYSIFSINIFFLLVALRHICVDSNQCEDEMICVSENVTKTTTGFNRNSNNNAPTTKVCLCDEENGFQEDLRDNRCNGKFFFNKYLKN